MQYFMATLAVLTGLTIALAETASTTPRQPIIRTGQTAHTFTAETTESLKGRYLLFLPEQYGRDDEKLPVILFLHGSGERGTNLDLVKKFGPPRVAEQQSDFPFIVLSPQCPNGKWWTDVDVMLSVMGMLDEVVKKYNADPDRIYLTGLSMGGYGTWQYAIQYPDKFAAIVPVCGWGNPYQVRRLKDVAVRIYHGANDQTIPVILAKQMAGALKAAGGNPELFVYPDLGHQCWQATYSNPMLYKWLLQHSRQRPGQHRRIER